MRWLFKQANPILFLAIIPAICFLYLGYFFERTQFDELMLLILALSFSYGYVLMNQSRFNWRLLFSLGLAYRLIFLFSIPALSDDFYRFIWDGLLITQGSDPFAVLPSELVQPSAFQLELLQGMNSPDYYSVYPPFLQYLFAFAAYLGGESILMNVVFFRLPIILAEVGSFFLLRAILRKLSMSDLRAFIYFLNPLVIIELSGNLHAEALWIFFFLMTVRMLMKSSYFMSGLLFSAAVLIKMLPLIFGPLLLFKIKPRSWHLFFLGIFIFTSLTTFTLIDPQTIHHMSTSIDLYFEKFEFNASLYYLFSWMGKLYYGYNPIQTLGPLIAVITGLLILAIQFSKRELNWYDVMKKFLLSITVYYLFALVVHPWYLAPLLLLASFRSYIFPLLWSLLIFLSYHRYALGVMEESPFYLALEYFPVYALLFAELTRGEKSLFIGIKQKVFNFQSTKPNQ
ncbi:MAG: hypothetical protein CMP59_09200 [Flavobacteriales bacterium]|nr:hypothetical protein [Flavobacteriales bacterium]